MKFDNKNNNNVAKPTFHDKLQSFFKISNTIDKFSSLIQPVVALYLI